MAKKRSLGWANLNRKPSVPGIGIGRGLGRGYGRSLGLGKQFDVGRGTRARPPRGGYGK